MYILLKINMCMYYVDVYLNVYKYNIFITIRLYSYFCVHHITSIARYIVT